MLVVRVRVGWVLIVAIVAGLVLAGPAYAALPPGTVTLASGLSAHQQFVQPVKPTGAGMIFSGASMLLTTYDGASSSTVNVGYSMNVCQSGTVATEVNLSTIPATVRWYDLTAKTEGTAPLAIDRQYFAPHPKGWLERNPLTGALYRVTTAGGAGVQFGTTSDSSPSSYACNDSSFAYTEAGTTLKFGSYTQGTIVPVATGSWISPLAVVGAGLVYRTSDSLFRWNGSASTTLVSGSFVSHAAASPTATIYPLDSPTGCQLMWHPVGGTPTAVPGAPCGGASTWLPTLGYRLGESGDATGGLYAVTSAGASRLWSPPLAPMSASAYALSAGRAVWMDDRRLGDAVWTRSVTGSATLTLGTEQLVRTSVSGLALAASGRRVAWADGTSHALRVWDGAAVRSFTTLGGPAVLVGHRVLTGAEQQVGTSPETVVNLVTGTSERVSGAKALWGTGVFRLDATGRIILRKDLVTRLTFAWLTAAEAGLPAGAVFTDVMVHGDLLAWRWMNPTTFDTGMGWRLGGPTRTMPPGTGLTAIWGRYLLARDLTGEAVVLDASDGHEVYRLPATSGGRGYGYDLGPQGLAWTSASGAARLTPLPDQHLVPRHEGNPIAPATLLRGSSWVGEWVFSEPLTSCAVDFKNSAGTVVRTLPCMAAYAAQGEAVVSWNGRDTSGVLVTPGTYQWVVRAGDADGPAVDVDGTPTAISGTVTVQLPPFVPLTPARVLDTRPGASTVDGQYVGMGPVGAGASTKVAVLGRGGVPTSGVSAVVLNVTGVAPTAPTFLTAYPSGVAVPSASTLNLLPGQVLANGAVVKVGTDGAVKVYNAAGATNVVLDVTGYYPTGGSYVSLTPARVTDTRPGATTTDGAEAGAGPLSPNTWRDVTVAGRAGVPTTGIDAVVVNLTGVAPTAGTFLTAYPAGVAVPAAKTQRVPAGGVVPNLAVVKLGTGGKIRVHNSAGSTNVVVDVLGYVPTGTSYTPMVPTRLFDTRTPGSPIGAGGTFDLTIAGRPGIPSDATAVIVNLTGVTPSASTFLSVYPAGTTRPNSSTVNVAAGDTRANAAYVKLNQFGGLTIYNAVGSTHATLDILGYFR